jgi:uncharacterized membrane protein
MNDNTPETDDDNKIEVAADDKTIKEVEEFLEQMPDEVRALLVRREWSAPLPPPQMLGQYEDVLAGCADRIVTMAEGEQSYRHQREKTDRKNFGTYLQSDTWTERLGLTFAFVVTMTITVGSLWVINNGYDVVGFAVIVGEMIGLVGMFLYREHQKSSDDSEQQQEAEEEKTD